MKNTSGAPTSGASTRLHYGDAIEIERVCDELTLIDELLELDGKDLLELGCGRAEMTLAIAEAGRDRRLLALEVDEVQHALNLQGADVRNVRFGLGGAQDIPADDGSFDVVFLFKSLHHVPVDAMDKALAEIARVLRPGGLAWISEPLFVGDFNEVLRIFHDERVVRRAAFDAVERSVRSGALALVSQTFFCSPLSFAGFGEFEQLVIGATHTTHALSKDVWGRVRSTFLRFEDGQGAAHFRQPMRIDLLTKPAGAAAG